MRIDLATLYELCYPDPLWSSNVLLLWRKREYLKQPKQLGKLLPCFKLPMDVYPQRQRHRGLICFRSSSAGLDIQFSSPTRLTNPVRIMLFETCVAKGTKFWSALCLYLPHQIFSFPIRLTDPARIMLFETCTARGTKVWSTLCLHLPHQNRYSVSPQGSHIQRESWSLKHAQPEAQRSDLLYVFIYHTRYSVSP